MIIISWPRISCIFKTWYHSIYKCLIKHLYYKCIPGCTHELQALQVYHQIINYHHHRYRRARFIQGPQLSRISRIFCFTWKLFHQNINNSLWCRGVTQIYLKNSFHKIVLLPFSWNLWPSKKGALQYFIISCLLLLLLQLSAFVKLLFTTCS